MTESILAALHYCTDEYGSTPSLTMSYFESIQLFEGTAEDYAKETYVIPDDLDIPDYIRQYMTLDYEQIIYDHHCNSEWHEFEHNGTHWLAVDESGDNESSSLDDCDPNEQLVKALLEQDIEAFQEAIDNDADLDDLLFTSRWAPLDFALCCRCASKITQRCALNDYPGTAAA